MLSEQEKEILIDTLLSQLDALGLARSCVNCANFNEQSEQCNLILTGNARPPARVIAKGCTLWEKDIPF